MGRRILMLAALAALVPASALAASGSASWAKPEIKVVVANGLMDAANANAFRPDDPLTRQELANLTTDLHARLQAADPAPATTTMLRRARLLIGLVSTASSTVLPVMFAVNTWSSPR